MSDILNGEKWHVHHGDSIPHMHEMPPESVDLAVFSPPFPAVYAYTESPADIGNSEDLQTEAKLHLSYFYNAMRRVLKPGRVMVVHVQQIPRMKRNDEYGLNDFRGLNIRIAERAGFVWEYDWIVRKNPQSQSIRTHAHEMQFSGAFDTDRAKCRGALCDYLLKFIVPGLNAMPVNSKGELTRNHWIDMAEGPWTDIIETDTLNTAVAKGENDTKHVCPLQLEVIRRLVLLFTNPGEIVFSPFAGIGSEGYMALGGISPKTKRSIKEPRRFYGIELKDEYVAAAHVNLARAVVMSQEKANLPLFPEQENGENTNPNTVPAIPPAVAPVAETPTEPDAFRLQPLPPKPKRARKPRANKADAAVGPTPLSAVEPREAVAATTETDDSEIPGGDEDAPF